MKQKNIIIGLLVLFFIMPFAAAAPSTCVYFFYGQGCPHCAQVEPFIDDLEEAYPDLDIHRFEVYNNKSNAALLVNYFHAYNVSQRGVPIVFVADQHYAGDAPIMNNLEQVILENPDAPCPGEQSSELDKDDLQTLSLLTIIGAALVDSINPCAIAVLLILMTALLASGNKRRALRAGFAFTISIYIAYFLFGLGLFSAIQVSGLAFWFYKAIGILAIIIGLLNIKDFLWYRGGGFAMEIPMKWRPRLKSMLKSVTTPLGAFVIGFVVCLFELPCTGGPYIFILGLLAQKTTAAGAIPLLLLYNLFFVLPLVIITLLVYFGYTSVEKADQWKEKNIRYLHLIAGIVMLILGVLVVSGIV